jgi:DNA-binding transcriptional ArsR family regulator
MWLRNPLDDILSSRAKVSLLRVLMRSPSPLNGREIGRRAGIDSGHASRQLRELALSGVLRSRDQGRVVTYEIGDDASGLVANLRNLFDSEGERYRDSVGRLTELVPECVSWEKTERPPGRLGQSRVLGCGSCGTQRQWNLKVARKP